ncbi:MAG: HAMP domain-containing histidine kinase [Lachnospiraceae bacterium]|nr:HAMP domain-containing histidine kinase [Lachnospiraceae bacterium]
MDWVEELLVKWKGKIRNFSLQKAMMAYMVIAIFLVVVACGITWEICDNWKNTIKIVNEVAYNYRYVGEGAFVLFFEDQRSISVSDLSNTIYLKKSDEILWNVLNGITVLCIPVYSAAAIFLVSVLYYKNKLREPISLLRVEMESIKRNDLSYSCFYDSNDEMGDICKTMDTMRKAVVDNQKNMWELLEEQRRINAAFAHDLRTPLTVISGYVDMLTEYYPKGQISEEKIMEILSAIRGQTVRLKTFSETMKKIDSFEVLEVRKKTVCGCDLEKDIKNLAAGLEGGSSLTISVTMQFKEKEICCDENIILEVLGNLLSNALRYGEKKIEILTEQQEDRLFLYVKDDGRGMTKEELYKADSPYYSDKTKNYGSQWNGEKTEIEQQHIHFGLGLTICKILCKKHGGDLSFSNSVDGGAIVCAEFFVG